ncbi:hypothetical protein ACKS0A_08590 [Histoplasma ohiense]
MLFGREVRSGHRSILWLLASLVVFGTKSLPGRNIWSLTNRPQRLAVSCPVNAQMDHPAATQVGIQTHGQSNRPPKYLGKAFLASGYIAQAAMMQKWIHHVEYCLYQKRHRHSQAAPIA